VGRLYKIFYLGQYKTYKYDRDAALKWIATEVRTGGGSFEDYEIVDDL